MQTHRTGLPQRGGFTLIELLVVIAIIALMAAILFPVFASAREKARQIACLSNSKEIALSFVMYAQDNDESFPCNIQNYVAWPPGTGSWMDMIFPYIKNTQVFNCPDAVVQSGYLNLWTPGAVYPRTSYGINNFYWDSGNPCTPTSACSSTSKAWQHGVGFMCPQYGPVPVQSLYPDPAGTVLVTENSYGRSQIQTYSGYVCTLCTSANAATTPCSTYIANYPALGNIPFYATQYGFITGRHNGGCNSSFMDGHSKWLPLTTLVQTDPNTGLLKYFSIDYD